MRSSTINAVGLEVCSSTESFLDVVDQYLPSGQLGQTVMSCEKSLPGVDAGIPHRGPGVRRQTVQRIFFEPTEMEVGGSADEPRTQSSGVGAVVRLHQHVGDHASWQGGGASAGSPTQGGSRRKCRCSKAGTPSCAGSSISTTSTSASAHASSVARLRTPGSSRSSVNRPTAAACRRPRLPLLTPTESPLISLM